MRECTETTPQNHQNKDENKNNNPNNSTNHHEDNKNTDSESNIQNESDFLGKCYYYIKSHGTAIRAAITLWSVFTNAMLAFLASQAVLFHRFMLLVIAIAFLINAVLFKEGKAKKSNQKLKLFQIISQIFILFISIYACLSIPQLGCLKLVQSQNFGATNIQIVLCLLSLQNVLIGPCIVLFDLFHRVFSVGVMAAILLTIAFYLVMLFTCFFLIKIAHTFASLFLRWFSKSVIKFQLWRMRNWVQVVKDNTVSQQSLQSQQQEQQVNNCAICMNAMKNSDRIMRLRCGRSTDDHCFHDRCIQSWFNIGGLNCPLCRQNLEPKWFKCLRKIY